MQGAAQFCRLCCTLLSPKTYWLFNRTESVSPLGALLWQYSRTSLDIEKEKNQTSTVTGSWMRCLNRLISERRGNTISTLNFLGLFLWLSKPSGASLKIRLFLNSVGRLISVSRPDKICRSASHCWGRMLMLSLLRNCRCVRTISLKRSARESAIDQSLSYAAVLTLPY